MARAALATALGRRDAAARGDLAAALRPSLVVGEPCPVCTQHVPALPPPLPGADVAALEAAVARAQAGLERALAPRRTRWRPSARRRGSAIG